ncbi:MAG TPA: sugar ABC transporter ATP-binding protein [Solirubrobacteraceae bacterium]|nr:sugar ABC transporter ATP-binding protein [Solirubrobacteraceae bacterium]
MPALLIDGMYKRFGAVRVLEGVDLGANRGEVHAVVGENGAGKSTLMRIVAGVIGADAGHVSLDDAPVNLHGPRRAAAAGIRMVFQELSTIPQMTVAENLLYGRERTLLGVVRGRDRRRAAAELLARFDLERIDPAARVAELGLGDRQLLEVVKALREPPTVLILDEATSALSRTDSAWVLEQGRRAARDGAVVLLITHRLREVREYADRVTVLRAGRDVLTGTPTELDDDALIAAMLGRRVERLYAARTDPRSDEALRVSELASVGLPGPVELSAREGEILGIGGLQGQGQRELLMALAGAMPWTAGRATLRGRPYRPSSPVQALAEQVAYVPEDRQREGLFLGQSVRHNITAAALRRFTRWGVLDRRAENRGSREGAETVGVDTARLAARVSTMSGGNQQKVVLAKAILDRPLLLLLHDCTRGVDVGTKADIFRLMAELAASGTTILFYSSDLSELVHMCHRVAVLVEGRVAGVIDGRELSEDAILRLAVGHQAHDTGAAAAGRPAAGVGGGGVSSSDGERVKR